MWPRRGPVRKWHAHQWWESWDTDLVRREVAGAHEVGVRAAGYPEWHPPPDLVLLGQGRLVFA